MTALTKKESKSSHITVRVTDTLKSAIGSIVLKDKRTETDVLTMMFNEYAPIKDRLVAPLLIPRDISVGGHEISFKAISLDLTILSVNGCEIELKAEDKGSINDFIANLLLFTQSV